jgi:DNA-binding response OmpR family regulator
MNRILLVEDSPEVQVMVRAALVNNFQLTIVDTIAKALDLIQQKSFDLFLIDVVLPDGNGFYLCAELRSSLKTKAIPVFFLTGKSDSKDKVMGFSIGADDYIVKPFDPLELRARISAKLKKITESQFAEEPIWKGNFRLDLSFQKAYFVENNEAEDLQLSPSEFRLFLHFIKHSGRVFSRDQLLSLVWGSSVHVSDRTVDAHVCNLRKKLSKKHNYIESVFGEGYRFLAPD